MCVFLSAVRICILSIDTVWYSCYRSCIHVINCCCILRMLLVITSMNDACSSCYQSIYICTTCYRSIMHSTNAIMRYCLTWGPTFHSLPTLCDSPNALRDRFKAYHVFDLELIYVCMAMRFYRFHQYMLLLASMLYLLLM